MRKYYTRPCNFHYGNYAKKLIKKKKALALAGNLNIAFDHLEIFYRKKRGFVQSKICPVTEIKDLDKTEIYIFALLVFLIIFFGVYPEPLLNTVDISTNNLIDNYQKDLSFYISGTKN